MSSQFGRAATPLGRMIWSAFAWALGFQVVTIVPAVILMVVAPGLPIVLMMALSMLVAAGGLFAFLRAKGVEAAVLIRGETDWVAIVTMLAITIGGLIFAALMVSGLVAVFGEQGMATDAAFAEMIENSAIPLVVFAIVLVAPLVEEFVYRGFFMGVLLARGWSAGLAIALTSAVFAAQHIQYGWIGMLVVFVYGGVFGLVRIASGGLAMPMLAHGIVNASALVFAKAFG